MSALWRVNVNHTPELMTTVDVSPRQTFSFDQGIFAPSGMWHCVFHTQWKILKNA